jgi:glycosyltransferase involved in cell wall biosynthesis
MLLRIAFVAHRFQHSDGQGRVNYEVVSAAVAHGHQVTLVTFDCAEEFSNNSNIRVINLGSCRLPTQLLRDMVFAHRSTRWLRTHRHEIDIVQANGFVTWAKSDIVAAHFVHSAWAKSPYYPFRSSLRLYALYQRIYTALNSRWEKRAFSSAQTIIAVSDIIADELQSLEISADRIRVIFNGVDTSEFAPGAADRTLFALPEGVPLVLFVGEIRTPRKNLDTLLRAMQHLPKMHLVVAGETRNSPYPQLTRDLNLSERVHYIGKTSNIASLMRLADLFVFPSHYEGHPLVVLEAMASGLPVIISSMVGSAKAFGDILQVLSDPNDEISLARMIEDLHSSPVRRKAMGSAARERALKMKWSDTAQQYLNLYQEFSRK